MRAVRRAVRLLGASRERYDEAPGLEEEARRCRTGAFDGGAAWMAAGLGALRGAPVARPARAWQAWGTAKYGACAVAATVLAAVAVAAGVWWLAPALVVLAFYGVEAQLVFLFPALLDGEDRPLAASRRLTVAAGGTVSVMATVLPLAVVMLFGGFVGQGFVRCWCLGCLAVLLWYEALRQGREVVEDGVAGRAVEGGG